MRGLLLAAAFAGVATAPPKKESKYDTVKELDKKAKAAMGVIRKREKGYLDKSIRLFTDCITRADPKSYEAQRIASQSVLFVGELYGMKIKDAEGDDEKQKLTKEAEVWRKAQPVHPEDVTAFRRAWALVERDWAAEDLKKKD